MPAAAARPPPIKSHFVKSSFGGLLDEPEAPPAPGSHLFFDDGGNGGFGGFGGQPSTLLSFKAACVKFCCFF